MKYIIYTLVALMSFNVLSSTSELTTIAEQSGWRKTGTAEETSKLCLTFQKKFPKKVKCLSYGKTPEGRSLLYMVVGNLKSPIVWVQAGIHAGEIDGKDAVFWLLKSLLKEGLKPDPLKGLCLVFIPIVNLDGHERIGKWNRPNQVGPEEMGWRTTAQNYNLNRDFVKVDAPEMNDLLKLWQKMDPVLSLDLHVTNGAQFQPEVGLIVHPVENHGSTALHKAGTKFETALLEKMKARGRLALPFYPNFEKEDDPLSGFSRYVSVPRFAHGYWYNNNRLGILVETHSWKNYATRVKTHYDTVLSALEIASEHADEWKKAGKVLDFESLAGNEVDLEYVHSEDSQLIDFGGYKFTKLKSHVSGAEVIKYFPLEKQNWKVPFYEKLKPSLVVQAPQEGYFVQPADAVWILPKLKTHNISFSILKKKEDRELSVYRASKTVFSPNSYEGHQKLVVVGEWKKEVASIPNGSLFIPIRQAKGRLILQMFEPLAQDSFLSWGFFNKAFEQKEYMENYVANDVAVEMLKDEKIKKDFETKLKEDSDFAKNPAKRFDFFYQKHPSYDERFNKYPVFKL